MPKVLRFIIYPVFFFVCLLAFLVLLFPFDSLKNRAARELEDAMGGTYQITIGKLSPSLLSGAVLKNVELKPRGDAAAPSIKVNQAKLNFGLIPLLSGTLEIDFDLALSQGRATGLFSSKRTGTVIVAKLDHFDLGLISFLTKDAGIPLTGLVSGNVNLDLNDQDPLRNAGQISLQVLDLGLGEIAVGGGFKIPAFRLAQAGAAGGSKIEVEINRGNFDIKSIQLVGGDVSLDSSGKIYGARRADNYRFNLKGSLRVTDEMAKKFEILSLVEKQKAADGSYPFTVTGRVLKPSIRIGDFKLPI